MVQVSWDINKSSGTVSPQSHVLKVCHVSVSQIKRKQRVEVSRTMQKVICVCNTLKKITDICLGYEK